MTDVLTEYLPTEWLDEVVPTPREDVNVFIHRDSKGWFLYPPEEEPLKNSSEEEGWTWRLSIEEGQRIGFEAYRNYGDFTLTIAADGSSSTDAPISDDANCFQVEHEIDSLARSLPELIEASELTEGTHDINAYFWSDVEYFFRFELVDGKGQLIAEGALQ